MKLVVAFEALCLCVLSPAGAVAATVLGGGNSAGDCAMVFEIPGANTPAPPRTPRNVDCVDGDPACDGDAERDGKCVFPLQLCINSTLSPACQPDEVQSIAIDHSVDNGSDRRFDADFQALALRAATLGLPSTSQTCTTQTTITVALRGPNAARVMRASRKSMRATAIASVVAGDTKDVDKVKFTCRPEGDAIYLPVDLYDGTFDRIRRQVFVQSCALSGCHDSESHSGDLVLLANAAYGNLVGVAPNNAAAAVDGLSRVEPGDPANSLLYRKITDDLMSGYGSAMPLVGAPVSAELIEIIRLWIIGDVPLGPAPQTGWVAGTDQ
ncbi:MAG: hypothetical protein HY899_17970 [Deltaproteobacteria bacterium]|nr:hypothetical protein [Deltaproteobacteria bacterium]